MKKLLLILQVIIIIIGFTPHNIINSACVVIYSTVPIIFPLIDGGTKWQQRHFFQWVD